MEKLLIVDDNLSILRVLKMRLESEGYQVEVASDIEGAKDLAVRNDYELAIFDMKLPDGNGIDLMKSIHEVDPDLPVIILTAYGTIESAVDAMKAGAYKYLKKPFDYRELLFQIRNGIEKSNLKGRSISGSNVLISGDSEKGKLSDTIFSCEEFRFIQNR